MASNTLYIIIGIVVLAGLSLIAWRAVSRLLRTRKFRKSAFYQRMQEIQEEYTKSIVKPSSVNNMVKGNKICITEPVSPEVFKKLATSYDGSQEFFVDIIAKHIMQYPNDFLEYYECVESNLRLSHQRHTKIAELIAECGMPDKLELKLLEENNTISTEAFGVAVELVIDTASATLQECVDLPYEYLKLAYEKFEKAIG